jgi:hypothetical protein
VELEEEQEVVEQIQQRKSQNDLLHMSNRFSRNGSPGIVA